MTLPGYPCVIVPTFTAETFVTPDFENTCGTPIFITWDGTYFFDGTITFG